MKSRQRFMRLYRRQVSRSSPRKGKSKKRNGCFAFEEALKIAVKRRSKKQRRKKKAILI